MAQFRVLSSIGDMFGSEACMPIHIISPRSEVEGPRTGFTPRGSIACAKRSCTTCRLRNVSLPHANSMLTVACANEALLRMRSIPGAPAIADSIGLRMSRSTSSAAIPSLSAKIVTVGLLMSGRISTFMVAILHKPAAVTIPAMTSTVILFPRDHEIILLNISCFVRTYAFGCSSRRELGLRPSCSRPTARKQTSEATKKCAESGNSKLHFHAWH
ncbi:MAG: hypothetical protein UX89_C0019G0026 [Parcubacteria group bacterium GW2011_GWA2_47_16]|nr:MAG: hypothetical protein UX89_C0019G0026 [Parcubacteria group bacterium GW2011_GWA2_47_16]